MNTQRIVRASDVVSTMLLRFYPIDFREDVGDAFREAYRDRFVAAARKGGMLALIGAFFVAINESLRNGVEERARPSIGWRRQGRWGRDAEHVLRRIVRAPAFALSVIGTLTIGLAAFAVVYTTVTNVLVAPLPYTQPENLYFVWRSYPWLNLERGWLAGTDIAALKEKTDVIEGAVAIRTAELTLNAADDAGGARPVQVRAMRSTPELFTLLGVQPLLGRVFTAEEVGSSRPNHTVLSYDLWKSRFNGDSAVLGRTLRLENEVYTVIGVMPEQFRFVRHVSLGTPEQADLYTTFLYHVAETDPRAGAFTGLIRTRPGVSRQQLDATVASLGEQVDKEFMRDRGMTLYAVDARGDLVKGVRPALTVMGWSAVLLVLVLTANLASLLLMRASQREREFAIARALGANSAALVRATVLEGTALGLAGGIGGALVAMWGTRALVALTPLDFPRKEAIVMDASSFLVTVAIGTTLGMLAGLVPALWATRTKLGSLLGSINVRGGGRRAHMRRAMAVVQIALSFVLLSSGALVVRTLESLLAAQPGFDASNTLTLRVPVTAQRFPTNEIANALHQRVETNLRSIPGVKDAGGGSSLPMTGLADQTDIDLPGAPGNTGDREHDSPLVDYFTARSGFIEALGIRVREGRAFQPDHRPGVREVMIDRLLADEFYPNGGAVGSRLVLGTDTATIVAVLEHARQHDLHVDGRPQVYLRDEDNTYGTLSWVISSDQPVLSLALAAQSAIRSVDPELAVADIRTMQDIVDNALRDRRLTATLVTGFAITAVLLAAMGLFGMVSSAVIRRRHEMAVRLALGAQHGGIVRMLVGESMLLLVVGVLASIPGVIMAGLALRGVIVGISPWDPFTMAAVLLTLAGVALLSTYLPARRVTTIQPASALRQE